MRVCVRESVYVVTGAPPPLRDRHTSRHILGPVLTGIPIGPISDPLQPAFIIKSSIKDPGFLNAVVLLE